ncbi:hypothetical protein SprV_0301134500 [Sparganum proliferum]
MAPAGLCPRLEATPVGRAGDEDNSGNELVQILANLKVATAAAAADVTASVEDRWCQLQDAVQSTALAVPCYARRQHQDWFDNNDAATTNLLAKKNPLHKAYVNRPTKDNKTAL